MHLESKALRELKEILLRDYGVVVSDEDAEELGVSLLRLTRVAVAVLTRTQCAEGSSGDSLPEQNQSHDKKN